MWGAGGGVGGTRPAPGDNTRIRCRLAKYCRHKYKSTTSDARESSRQTYTQHRCAPDASPSASALRRASLPAGRSAVDRPLRSCAPSSVRPTRSLMRSLRRHSLRELFSGLHCEKYWSFLSHSKPAGQHVSCPWSLSHGCCLLSIPPHCPKRGLVHTGSGLQPE